MLCCAVLCVLGSNVWHERWGEDYDAGGDACVKWTDKWAERLLPGGAREQWGDKWHEAFANGVGEKNGEVSREHRMHVMGSLMFPGGGGAPHTGWPQTTQPSRPDCRGLEA
jgi:hypothetical protein